MKYEELPDEVKEWTDKYIKRSIRKSHPQSKLLSNEKFNIKRILFWF